MTKVTKPATPQAAAKPGAGGEAGTPTKKSKKKLIVAIIVAVVLIGAGVVAFLLLTPPQHSSSAAGGSAQERAENEARSSAPPRFVDLGTFTANLVSEDGDRYLQVAITIKITKSELDDKISTHRPEILHHINMVLQSKRASELANLDGKLKLAEQIKGQVEYVLGLRRTAPPISSGQANAEPVGARPIRTDIAEVLFTSFIIQ